MMSVALAVLAALQASHPAAPDTAHVVLVSTTDVHGRALGWDYVRDADGAGGVARAATILVGRPAEEIDPVTAPAAPRLHRAGW